MLSVPVVPVLELLEADDDDDDELAMPDETSVSMYCALLVLLDGLVPVVPVALLAWLDGSRQPVSVTVLELDFCELF